MTEFENREGVMAYNINTTVCDFDAKGEMTLFAIMKFQEDAAEKHAEQMGLGYEEMYSKNMAFLVNSTQNTIHRMPKYNEKITIYTWSDHTKGVRFYRGFEWYNQNGEHLISGCNVYVLVDVANHRPLPSTRLYKPLECTPYGNDAISRKPHAILDNVKSVGTRKIMYTDLDLNNHLNNARYADIIQNFLPDFNRTIKYFCINFVKELKLDMCVDINADTCDNATHICGECDDTIRFKGSVEYAD